MSSIQSLILLREHVYVCFRTLTWVWDEWVLCLVTGWLRQQHRPSPTGHASRPQDQHALQQQQCMLGHWASHVGLGSAHFSSGLRGQQHWRDTPEGQKENCLSLNKYLRSGRPDTSNLWHLVNELDMPLHLTHVWVLQYLKWCALFACLCFHWRGACCT